MGKRPHYVPVRGIRVFLWGRSVGALVEHSPGYYAFEYDSDFLSSGWHNQHAIKVNGKRSDITDEDLLVVATGLRSARGGRCWNR